MTASHADIKNIDFRVITTDALSYDDLARVHQLFNETYHQANHSYLEKSFKQL